MFRRVLGMYEEGRRECGGSWNGRRRRELVGERRRGMFKESRRVLWWGASIFQSHFTFRISLSKTFSMYLLHLT